MGRGAVEAGEDVSAGAGVPREAAAGVADGSGAPRPGVGAGLVGCSAQRPGREGPVPRGAGKGRE